SLLLRLWSSPASTSGRSFRVRRRTDSAARRSTGRTAPVTPPRRAWTRSAHASGTTNPSSSDRFFRAPPPGRCWLIVPPVKLPFELLGTVVDPSDSRSTSFDRGGHGDVTVTPR